MGTGATAIPIPLKRPLPLTPVAVGAHLYLLSFTPLCSGAVTPPSTTSLLHYHHSTLHCFIVVAACLTPTGKHKNRWGIEGGFHLTSVQRLPRLTKGAILSPFTPLYSGAIAPPSTLHCFIVVAACLAPTNKHKKRWGIEGDFTWLLWASPWLPKGAVDHTLLECADAAVHSQSPRRSILCRLFWMLQWFFYTCESPPADFHRQTVPLIAQTGWKRRTQCTGSHTHSPQQARTIQACKELQSQQGRYNIWLQCSDN